MGQHHQVALFSHLQYSFLAQCQVFCVERMVINYMCIDLRKYLMHVSVQCNFISHCLHLVKFLRIKLFNIAIVQYCIFSSLLLYKFLSERLQRQTPPTDQQNWFYKLKKFLVSDTCCFTLKVILALDWPYQASLTIQQVLRESDPFSFLYFMNTSVF